MNHRPGSSSRSRRQARGIAPLELVLVFPILLVLGGMIMGFQMVMIRSAHNTMEARRAAWEEKGGPMENDEALHIEDVHVMAPMLPSGGEVTMGVIHREARGQVRLPPGYLSRLARTEEHHYLVDDCWNHERLTQYRGHGRLEPDPFMVRFVTALGSAGWQAARYMPWGYPPPALTGAEGAAFGLFGGFKLMASIPSFGFANAGLIAALATPLQAALTSTIILAGEMAAAFTAAQQYDKAFMCARAIQLMTRAQAALSALRAIVGA